MRQPRLLMLVHDHIPEEVRVVAQIRAAVAAGFAVDVIALRGEGEAPEEVLDGARVFRLPVAHRWGGGKFSLLSEFLGFTVLSSLKAAALARRHRYDVVETHNPPDFLVVGGLVPRLLGAKTILDVHDLTPDMYMMRFDNAPRGLLDNALRLVEVTAARASDAVLTVHEPYRRELGAHGVPVDKVSVVMNSLDESVLPAEPTANGSGPGFRVVYHGTVTPHYGVDLLVEAAALARARIPDLRLEIYGAGDALADVMERVRERGMSDRVEVVPRFLPHSEVLHAIRGASVGVVPNRATRLNRFALSTKLLEYAALGIPAVSADLPTIREHFSDAELSYFEPGDATSLARALEDVAADPDAAHRRAEAARRRYEDYRWERSERVYQDLIWRLAGRRRRGLQAQRPTAGV
jgi:glycosyltransferase involved in cell wall biosynthesis